MSRLLPPHDFEELHLMRLLTKNTFLWLRFKPRKGRGKNSIQSKCVKPRTHVQISRHVHSVQGHCVCILLAVSSYPGRRSWRTSVCWPCTPPLSSGPHTLACTGSCSASPSHSCGAVLLVCCRSRSHVSHI